MFLGWKIGSEQDKVMHELISLLKRQNSLQMKFKVNSKITKLDILLMLLAERLSRILSLAPGLQEMIPLLHPILFSSIISKISHSFEVMTMFKAELPAIDLGILVSGYPPILTWSRRISESQ